MALIIGNSDVKSTDQPCVYFSVIGKAAEAEEGEGKKNRDITGSR